MSLKNTQITKGATGGLAVKRLRSFRAPKIRVKVTEEIVATACRANSFHCMVSDAVKRAAPWADHIASDLQSIRITDPRRGLRYTYLTPRTAQLALIAFDQGKKVPPFEFTLGGGHVATSFKRTVLPSGKEGKQAIHKLGRRKLVPRSNGEVAGTIGGAAGVPLGELRSVGLRGRTGGPTASTPAGSKPRAPTSGHPGRRREFGMRAFTGAFKLEDLETIHVPVGAPSISDR